MTDLVSDFVFDDICEDAFPYLDDLRESGVTNMIASPSYLMEDFDIDKQMAIKVFIAWKDELIKKTDDV